MKTLQKKSMNLTNFEDILRTDIFQVDGIFPIKWRN